MRFKKHSLIVLGFALLAAAKTMAQASSCSSDGQTAPTQLVERFLSANCAECWSQAAPAAAGVAIDWIVPSAKEEDAPLSAAALLDASARLDALKLKAPSQQTSSSKAVLRSGMSLRVAHGLPFNGYLGASIQLQATAAVWRQLARSEGGEISAHLAVVENIPAGAEGTPIARKLVRNLFSPRWNIASQLSKLEQKPSPESEGNLAERPFYAFQPISIPEGAKGNRLAVVGWVQNAKGQMLAIAQSVCPQ